MKNISLPLQPADRSPMITTRFQNHKTLNSGENHSKASLNINKKWKKNIAPAPNTKKSNTITI
jgi:hypothetical protein